MPPTVKENELLSARPETAQRPSAADSGAKHQPVALEVPVTVNGARTVDGGDKREPFSESTKTVLVFGNGAVIRLTSSVAPGQLLFLTNERTKKEVVCQVVKSKNYRNVSGYVELEFTESVVGFWGMRFPGDRIGSGPQPGAPAAPSSNFASGSPAIPRPVAPRVEAPAMNATLGVVAAKPVAPVSLKAVEPKLAESKFVAAEVPAAPVSQVEATIPQRPMAPVLPLTSSLSTSFDPTASLNLSTAPPPVSAAPVEFAAPIVPVAPALLVAPVSTIPEVAVTPAIVKPMISSESATFDAPRISEAAASFLEPAKSSTGSLGGSATSLLSLFEAKPAVPVAPPPAPLAVDPETEELKKQTARLQEQLSSMLFSEKPAKQETVSVQIPHAPAVTVKKELAESAAKILEMSRASEPEPAPVRPMETVRVEAVKVDAPAAKSALGDEELKIPAWLEPLARNAAAPASTQELIEKEKGKGQSEQTKLEETAAPPVTNLAEEAHLPELPLPSFIEPQPTGDARSSSRKSSGTGFVIGAVAAGVLVLAGGGWWFMQQKPTGAASAPATGAQASVISNPAGSAAAQPQGNAVAQANPPEQQANPGTLTNASEESSAGAKVPSVVPAVSTSSIGRNTPPVSNPGGRATTSTAAVPVAEQPKKPALGELHLAAPKVSTSRNAQNVGEPDAGITLTADDQPDSNADLGAGLIGGNKQPSAPAAPLPVGGDVKQAKLISSVAPMYPPLAKNQHVSGNVQVDALIDANGKVTTMKVVSGPTLLHQAAMDALRQWKYQPATLDGKAVAMHLTVTLQFRLQ